MEKDEVLPMVAPITHTEYAGDQYKNFDNGPLYKGLPALLLPVHVYTPMSAFWTSEPDTSIGAKAAWQQVAASLVSHTAPPHHDNLALGIKSPV
tara:strand:- start:5353 stop:5634 length:282 start_codon:yes stop_codon:yes gene_type:complete